MKTKMKSKGRLPIIVIGGVVIVCILVFDVPCLIRAFTGVPCPTCGMTRAWISFFQGDFSRAFHYHLLFPLLPICIVLLYLYDQKKTRSQFIFFITPIAILALNLVYYIYRLMNGLIP